MFHSNCPGGLGGNDIWTSTRRSIHDAWRAATNLGGTINSTGDDATPSLSLDGSVLLFDSARPGGAGGRDIWMTTGEK